MKLDDDDALIGFKTAKEDKDTLLVKTSAGGEQRINTAKYEVTQRGGKGREVIKRGSLTEVIFEPPAAPAPFTPEETAS
jgi:DNA gyrase subunit A